MILGWMFLAPLPNCSSLEQVAQVAGSPHQLVSASTPVFIVTWLDQRFPATLEHQEGTGVTVRSFQPFFPGVNWFMCEVQEPTICSNRG